MSYTNDRESTALNQSAAHDTGLYDESRHDNQIVAMYDTDTQARAAKDMLVGKGVSASTIQLVARGTDVGTLGGVNAEDGNGVWGALKSLFVPEDDHSAYTHAVGRGHAMLVVTPAAGTDRVALVHALESTDPVDFDAKLEEWRQAGYDTSTPHKDYVAGMPPAMDSPVAAMADADPVVAGIVPAPVTGYSSTEKVEFATPAATSRPVTDKVAMPTTSKAVSMGDNDTIKVVEERLRVGKREVAAGAVRVRSYIVERPVEEQVTLHSESVQVERRPVDRAATAADMTAFQERTIEARATAEEAVVSKEARVIEEIGLKKTASDRTETIRDTVRKTEVEVEDGTTVSTSVDPVTGKTRLPGV